MRVDASPSGMMSHLHAAAWAGEEALLDRLVAVGEALEALDDRASCWPSAPVAVIAW
jgi:hypothetical protein